MTDIPQKPKSEPFEFGPFFFTIFVSLVLFLGWRASIYHLLSPKKFGVGYFLGIIGGVLMLLLLWYPVEKRKKYADRAVKIRTWFKIHMILGVLGPAFVMFHCNFHLGDLNSNIALLTMLTVAISGVFGRYFYIRIHQGLYGEKETLTKLQSKLKSTSEEIAIVLTHYPNLVKELNTFVEEYTKPSGYTVSSSLFQVLETKGKVSGMKRKLMSMTRSAILAHAKTERWSPSHIKETTKVVNGHIKSVLNTVLKVSQFNFYERLFSLWHVLHIPLFFIMISAIVVHIVATHLY